MIGGYTRTAAVTRRIVPAFCVAVSTLVCLSGTNGRAEGLLPPITKSPIAVELRTLATGLAAPNQLVPARDGTGRLFVVEQPGTVRVLSGTMLSATPLLDISATTLSTGWRGLHGAAVHPGFADLRSAGYRKVYAITSEAAGTRLADLGTAGQNGADHQSVLYEWSIDADNPAAVDPATKREILRIDEPGTIHGLYSMAFGPDGYLYLGIGDGAGGGDPFNLAQDPATIHGTIVRINVDATDGRNGQYGIPVSNPFASGTLPGGGVALPEVFAYGFRNPWRMSFDAVTGDLYVGEVGRAVIEEINLVTAGGNYGWPLKEGTFRHYPNATVSTDLSGLPEGLIDPLAQYEHDEGVAIMGGFVYRGSAIPELVGQYVFGDFGMPMGSPPIAFPARLFSLDLADLVIRELQIGLDDRGFSTIGGRMPLGFGEDEFGELYVLTSAGEVLQITAVPEPWTVGLAAAGLVIAAWRCPGRRCRLRASAPLAYLAGTGSGRPR
jgi:glucose/arabinose dehydrogenase